MHSPRTMPSTGTTSQSLTIIPTHPTSQCCLLESWQIVSQPGSLNREVGPLPEVYRALLPPKGQRTDNKLFHLSLNIPLYNYHYYYSVQLFNQLTCQKYLPFIKIITCHRYLYSGHPVPEHLTTEDGSCITTKTPDFVFPNWLVIFTKRWRQHNKSISAPISTRYQLVLDWFENTYQRSHLNSHQYTFSNPTLLTMFPLFVNVTHHHSLNLLKKGLDWAKLSISLASQHVYT